MTATEGVYMFCKFDIDIPKGCGDIAPRILAGKWKCNWLWEFPEIIIWKKYVASNSAPCVLIWDRSINIWPPLGPPELFFENSKIFSIFNRRPDPYGSQPMVTQKSVSPIIYAWWVTILAR